MPTFLGIDYATWWFLVLGAVFSGYAMLDGFDLGAGMLHLFLKKEDSRRIALNAIGPVWDGNEVWLVIGGGALFAGFPEVYAALLPAFYVPFILFLVALIWRAIAIEFRGKEPMPWWRRLWDGIYFFSSALITLLLGIVLGNVIGGIALDANRQYTGSMWDFFNPLALLTSITTAALFMLHGALYLAMKTEGRLYAKIGVLAKNFTIFFVLSLVLLTLYILLYVPHLSDMLRSHPGLFILPAVLVLAVANIPRQINRRNYRFAFLSSLVVIATLLILVAFELYPTILRSTIDPAYSLTVQNSASSPKTMGIMLLIAAIGTPFAAGYTLYVYWTFKGKVALDEHSY